RHDRAQRHSQRQCENGDNRFVAVPEEEAGRMKRLILCAIVLSNFLAAQLPAQGLSNATLTSPTPKAKKSKDPTKKNPAGPEGPITTEIYAEHAFFDSAKSVGVFT